MSRLRLNFQLPGRFELFLLVMAGLFLIVFDWTQNMFQSHENLNYPLLGTPAIYLFWLTFIAYHIMLFIAFGRAIKIRGTHYLFDWVAGSIAFMGMFFLLVGGIGAMYYAPEEALPFFFNIPQITIYHFGGVAMQLLALGYFIVTE
jgi:hypothetical protein